MDRIFKISFIPLLVVRSIYIIVCSYFHKSVLISFLKELQESYFNLMSQKTISFQILHLLNIILYSSHLIQCRNRSTWYQPEYIKFNYMHLHSSLPNFPKAQFFTSYIYRHCTNNKHLSLPTREKVSLYFCHTLVNQGASFLVLQVY